MIAVDSIRPDAEVTAGGATVRLRRSAHSVVSRVSDCASAAIDLAKLRGNQLNLE